jgi:GTP-binding protein
MYREGFELEVGPPTVIYKENKEMDKIEEPWESVEICIP